MSIAETLYAEAYFRQSTYWSRDFREAPLLSWTYSNEAKTFHTLIFEGSDDREMYQTLPKENF